MTIQRLQDTASAVAADLDKSARARAADLLAQVVHDMNNPIGTFTLELYTLQTVLAELDRSLPNPAYEQERGTLTDLHANLVAAVGHARQIVGVLQQTAEAWRGH